MPQDINFNGFDVGQKIGAAIAEPIDLTPLNDFIIKQNQTQADNKASMLSDVMNNLSTFNPDGIMAKDMPDAYKAFNDYKDEAINNITALQDPANNMDEYQKILDKKQQLFTTLAKLKAASYDMGVAQKYIMTGNLNGVDFSNDTLDYWKSVYNTPTLKQNAPIDFSKLLPMPNPGMAYDSAVTTIGKSVKPAKVNIPSADNKTFDQWSLPNYSAVRLGAQRAFMGIKGLSTAVTNQFNNATPDEKAQMATEIKNMYGGIPTEYIGQSNKLETQNFQVDSPMSYFEGQMLLQFSPQLISSGTPNPQFIKQQQLGLENKRIDIQQKQFYSRLNQEKQTQYNSLVERLYSRNLTTKAAAYNNQYTQQRILYKDQLANNPNAAVPVRSFITPADHQEAMRRAKMEAQDIISGKSTAAPPINFLGTQPTNAPNPTGANSLNP